MKRRDFLYTGFAGAIAPVFLGGMSPRSLKASVVPAATCDFSNRALVIIYLAGANDVINASVPLNQLSSYNSNRPSIAIPENNLITLDNGLADAQQLGLHPNLTSFKDLYDGGLMQIIQRVGYPTPNRSHFVSEDIWLKGIDGTVSNAAVETGWLGRFLKDRYPTYKGLPFGTELDPLGMILGETPDTGFHTAEEHETSINLSGQDPAGFYNIISSLSGEPISLFPDSDYGQLLQYISTLEKSTQVYSQRITQVFNAGTNSVSYPDTEMGDQLKTIARFLSGGITTKVFMGRKGGWDTHANQLERQALLLQEVSEAVKTFQTDLENLGLSDRVTTVIFSEFGRKIIQNGNVGTDHGTVSSMYIVGKNIQSGVLGDNINLDDKDEQGAPNPLQLQNDYRSVFSSILQDWMGASNDSLTASFPNTPVEVVLTKLPIIGSAAAVSDVCYFDPVLPIQVKVSLKVFLEGFMLPDGTLSTSLVVNALLPLEQPFGSTNFGYYGSETLATIPPDTVDWMLLEIWNGQNLVLGRKPVLLRKDGQLMELDGNTEITFENIYPENSCLAVFHRSHLGAKVLAYVTPDEVNLQSFDISTSLDSVEGKDQLKLVQGKYALIAGDVDQNGLINSADYTLWKKASEMEGMSYGHTDLNADGISDASDFSLLHQNRSKIAYPDTYPTLKTQ